MLGYSPFYNAVIKKATIAFGSLFADMRIIREANGKKQSVNVPLLYASGDSAINRKYEDPDLKKSVASTYPRMSYYMDNISYDSTRTVSSVNSMITTSGIATTAPAPYILTFNLWIITANFEDGLQIVEQILPFFKPDYTVSINAFPELDLDFDLTFSLNGVEFTDPNADDVEYTTHRLIEWKLTFKCPILLAITAEELLEEGRKLITQTDMRMYLWDKEDYFYHESAGDAVIPHWAKYKEHWHLIEKVGVRHYLIRFNKDNDMYESTVKIIGKDCGIYKHNPRELSFTEKTFLEKMDNYLKDLIVKLNILPKGRKPTANYDYKTLTLTLGIPKETAPVKGKDYFTETEIKEIQDRITLMFKENLVVKYTCKNKRLPLKKDVAVWDIQHNIGSKVIVFNVFDAVGNLITEYGTEFIDENLLRLTFNASSAIPEGALTINIIG